MILTINAYGHPTLRKIAKDIDKDYPNLDKLIADMFETMYFSKGVGLAAPQVDFPIRLIVIDTIPFKKEYPEAMDMKKIMINAHIVEESGNDWLYNEGCLSVPNIHEDILRKSKIKIEYLDENFVEHVEEFEGINARVIQHEYDHLEGKLFVDRVSPLKKMILKRKLTDISKGIVDVDYKMNFPFQNKRRR